jgi:hypothetical protein
LSLLIGILIVAAVPMGGGFGDAEATTVTLGSQSMVIDLSVEVEVVADSVLAHLSSGGETMLVPLVEREPGLYGIRTAMPVKNWVVVFEILGPEGELSQPVSLGFLGAELGSAATSMPEQGEEVPSGDEARRWGFLALALAAGSLSALAFWVLGGRDAGEEPESEEE